MAVFQNFISGSRCPQRFVRLGLAALLTAGIALPARATDQMYVLQSPNFGGSNPASLQAAEYVQSLQQQQAQQRAAAAAALANAATNTTTQQFANSLISQLESLVARNVALEIAGSAPGAGGTIQAGGVSITYVNQDGTLNVSITSPTGTTTFSMPSGS